MPFFFPFIYLKTKHGVSLQDKIVDSLFVVFYSSIRSFNYAQICDIIWLFKAYNMKDLNVNLCMVWGWSAPLDCWFVQTKKKPENAYSNSNRHIYGQAGKKHLQSSHQQITIIIMETKYYIYYKRKKKKTQTETQARLYATTNMSYKNDFGFQEE